MLSKCIGKVWLAGMGKKKKKRDQITKFERMNQLSEQ